MIISLPEEQDAIEEMIKLIPIMLKFWITLLFYGYNNILQFLEI